MPQNGEEARKKFSAFTTTTWTTSVTLSSAEIMRKKLGNTDVMAAFS